MYHCQNCSIRVYPLQSSPFYTVEKKNAESKNTSTQTIHSMKSTFYCFIKCHYSQPFPETLGIMTYDIFVIIFLTYFMNLGSTLFESFPNFFHDFSGLIYAPGSFSKHSVPEFCSYVIKFFECTNPFHLFLLYFLWRIFFFS